MVIVACIALTLLQNGVDFEGTWHEADFMFWEELNFRSRTKSGLEEKDHRALSDEEVRIETIALHT